MDKIAADIINFKMNQNENVLNYIGRFDKKRMQYDNEVAKRSIKNTASIDVAESSKKRKDKSIISNQTDSVQDSTCSTTTNQENHNVEFVITESGFVKYFIKGINIKTVKRLLKLEKPTSLEDAYSFLREMYDSDDEESETNASPYPNNESSDESSEEESVKVKTNTKPLKPKKTNPASPPKDETLSTMINEFKNMSLMIGELVTFVNKNEPKKKKTTCWNCLSLEHYTKDCVQPCKLCNSPSHKHYECNLYKNNRVSKTNNDSVNESMLMEDNYMAEKRKLDGTEDTANNTKNVRITRSGETYPTPRRKKQIQLPTSEVIMEDSVPILENYSQNVTQASAPISIPKHPMKPALRHKMDMEDRDNRINTIVDHVMNEPVHLISLNDLATICTPTARTRIKNKMIKPQSVKRLKKVEPSPSEKTALLGEVASHKLPKGKSAPRTYGKINDQNCEVILDGGCTSYIVSLNFLNRLGITEVEPSNTSVMFGDGNSYPPIGLATNLNLQIGGSKTISVNALCYDVGDQYDFIVGREGLHALKFGTDWSSHYWYIKTESGVLPCDVHYTRYFFRTNIDSSDDEGDYSDEEYEEDVIDQDDHEEDYLIMAASDDESGDEFVEVDHTDLDLDLRLGTLLSRISEQHNINDQDKKQLTQMVINFKNCFGTGYEHLSQTNLLIFHVDTGQSKPIYKRPYGFLSMSEKQMLKKDLEEMVKNGILVPNTHVPGNSAHSGWSFPCSYVPKKTGDKRLVTNFKELNAVTVRDT